MSDKSRPQRGSGHRLRLFAVFLSVLLAIGAGLWWARGMLMQWGLQQLMQRPPLSESVVSGVWFNFGQARLANIQFGLLTDTGPVSMRLEDVRADYNLRASKLNSIQIAKARLRIAYQPTSKVANIKQSASAVPILPLQRIAIESLDAQIDTPWGLTSFVGSAELNIDQEQAIHALFQDTEQSIRLELAPDLSTAKLWVEQNVASQVLQLDYQRLAHTQHRATLDADASLLLQWLKGSGLIPDKLKQSMTASPVIQTNPNITAMKLKLTAQSHDNLESLQGRLLLTRDDAYLSSAEWDFKTGNSRLNVDGHLDLTTTEAIDFFKPWLPETMNTWRFNSGHLMGTLHVGWRPQTNITGSVYLKAYQVGLVVGAVQAEEGFIQLDIKDLAKLSMVLSLEVPKLALGKDTKVHDLMLKAHYLKNQLTLERATLPLFGGMIEVLPQTVDFDQFPLDLTLVVRNIDLAQLLDSLNYPALSGTGTLNGKLPLRLSPDSIEVSEGSLTGTVPGVLRYQGPTADNENIAFKALRNMLYHSLQAKLNYRPNGEYQIGLRMEGKNPQVLSGHPVAFNLNLGGKLPELLQKGILAGNFDQPVLDQVNGGKRR